MGRPGCSSCCDEVLAPPKVGCEHIDFDYYYDIGGGWLDRKEYLDELVATGNVSGHLDLQGVKIVASKPDYGEYRTAVKGWVFPTGFGDDNEAFKNGNQNQGVHLPREWSAEIGSPAGVGDNISIRRNITGKSERVHYVNGHFLGFKDKQGNKECGRYGGPIRDDQGRSWGEDLQVYLDGLADDIKTVLQVRTTKFMVEWVTDVFYGNDRIYREKKCFHYKTTWELFDRGADLGFEELEEKLIDHEECGVGGGDLGGFVEEYGTFNYCLTYPFFSHDGDTYYFPLDDIQNPTYNPDFFLGGLKLNTWWPALAPSVATIQDDKQGACDARGTNDWYLDAVGPGGDILGETGLLHHANHHIFNSITVTSEDFIVFNPYSDTWKSVTAGEFNNYDSSCASVGEPLFNGIVEATTVDIDDDDDPNTPDVPTEIPLNREDLEKNLEIKEKLVSGPTFIFVDNKLRSNEYDIPQVMYAEDEANSSRLPYYEVDGGSLGDTGLAVPGTVIKLFKYLALKEGEEGGAPLRDHVIVVHMRSNRSVEDWQNAGNLIEVGDKVHWGPSSDQFTVTSIESSGENTKPLTVKLSNGQVVGVNEIEALDDNVSYAMNGRTYYLQKTYLKDGEDGNGNAIEYSNPYKYKVKRIDLRNPNADVRVGWEIAQFEALPASEDDPELYVNPTYIELTTTDSWSSIPDEYFEKDPSDTTYWSISGNGADPFKIKPLIGPPKELFDGQITFTSPVGFQLKQAPPRPETHEETFASRETTHPNFDESCSVSDTGTMWVITIQKDDKESNTFVEMPEDEEGGGGKFKKEIEFDNKQLPDNGYLFGPYIELKFYLEEI